MPAIDPATLVVDCERRARRFTTPCGDGSLVWRSWGSGPAVVLAHGSNGSWAHWIRNIDALAATHTVWAVDLPGWGDSAMPASQDHDSVVDVIAAGLRQLPLQLPVAYVGFSFGGVVGAYLAARHPELLQRLILVDTGGLDTPVGQIHLQRVRGLEGEQRRAVLRANLLGLMLHHAQSADDLAVHIQDRYAPGARFDTAAFVLPDKLLQVLPNITVPLDAIWGEHDRPHPVPSVQEEVLRRFHPKLRFRVVADAGHWAMYERPSEFNRLVAELLGSG